jgi:hypothetical protein
MDVLWFRLPHLSEEIDAPGGAFGGFAPGHIVGGFDRKDYWQALFVIAKGAYQSLRAAGIEGLRRRIVEIWPVRIIQALQTQIQRRVIATALKAQEQQGLSIPWFVRAFTRIPFLRDVPRRIMALGVVRVRVEN